MAAVPIAKIKRLEQHSGARELVWVQCPYCGKQHLHGVFQDSEGWRLRLRECWRGERGGQYVIASISTFTDTSELHVLYRFYAHDGALLYVGVTKNPPARFGDHQRTKDWWKQVWMISLEHRPSRHDLLAAESAAIRDEHPLHNIAGTAR